jgi:hypothetical protein
MSGLMPSDDAVMTLMRKVKVESHTIWETIFYIVFIRLNSSDTFTFICYHHQNDE